MVSNVCGLNIYCLKIIELSIESIFILKVFFWTLVSTNKLNWTKKILTTVNLNVKHQEKKLIVIFSLVRRSYLQRFNNNFSSNN